MRPEKQAMADEFRSRVKDAAFMILADYRGLSVSKTDELRRRLRGVNARMQVIQNRVFRAVAKEASLPGLEPALKGPSALVYGPGDVVQAAKVLKDFVRENERPKIKAGALAGALITAQDVEQLAGLPAREVLLAQMLGTIAAPMTRLAGVLNQKVASIVYALKAVQEKKEKAS
jgi:large subunit ribosomal protein L10